MEFKVLNIHTILANPLQPRTSFDRIKLNELADSIKEHGVLEPILVRPKKGKYEIIAGERRWKASQIAGNEEIPAIIRDMPDYEAMIISLIENVHRDDLKPLEKSQAIQTVFKASGFDVAPSTFLKNFHRIEGVLKHGDMRKLSREDKKLYNISKEIGYSLKRINIYLRPLYELEDKELEEIGNSEMSASTIASIGSIKDKKDRQSIIKKIKEDKLFERGSLSLIRNVKEAPEPVKKELLQPKSHITPQIAQEILKLDDETEQEAVVREVKSFRLDEEETRGLVELMKVELPSLPPEKIMEVREAYESLMKESKVKLKKPDTIERGKLFKNWLAHTKLRQGVDDAVCPICGAGPENLVWKCHDLNIPDALTTAHRDYQNSINRGKKH